MNVQFFSTSEVFDDLAEEWDTLLDSGRSDTIFLTHKWQQNWWRHLGVGDLAIMTIREGDGILRGIAPCFIDDWEGQQVLRMVGCVEVADYLDLIVEPGYEPAVFDAWLGFLLSDKAPHWDVIDLCNIPQGSTTLTCLEEIATGRGLPVNIRTQEVCPVIDLPSAYEGYLEYLDKKQRHELRRKRRRADGFGLEFYTITGGEPDFEHHVSVFMALLAASTPEKAAFLERPGYRAFLRDAARIGAAQGFLNLVFLAIEGTPIASMWQFAYKNRMMLYNSGLNQADYATLSPGIVLLTYSIEDSIQRGFTLYDFLRGDEDYKFRMGAKETTVHNLTITRG